MCANLSMSSLLHLHLCLQHQADVGWNCCLLVELEVLGNAQCCWYCAFTLLLDIGTFQDCSDQSKWHGVLLVSCRKPFEHLGIFDDVASRSLGSMHQVDNIKISVHFTNLCQHIGKVFSEFKQGIACTLASCLTPAVSALTCITVPVQFEDWRCLVIHMNFFNKHHQLCESKSCYCMFIICTFSCHFLNLPCAIVQDQETISVILGFLCNHVPSVGMSQHHEDQHSQELLHRRSISLLGVLSQYLMVVPDIEFTFGHQLSQLL